MEATFLYASAMEGEISVAQAADVIISHRASPDDVIVCRGMSVPYPGMPNHHKSLGQIILEAYGYPIPAGSLIITQNSEEGSPVLMGVNALLTTLSWATPVVPPYFRIAPPISAVNLTAAVKVDDYSLNPIAMTSSFAAAPFVVVGTPIGSVKTILGADTKRVANSGPSVCAKLRVQWSPAPSNHLSVALLTADDGLIIDHYVSPDPDLTQEGDVSTPFLLSPDWASQKDVVDEASAQVRITTESVPLPVGDATPLRIKILVIKPRSWRITRGQLPSELVNMTDSNAFYSYFDQDNPILKY